MIRRWHNHRMRINQQHRTQDLSKTTSSLPQQDDCYTGTKYHTTKHGSNTKTQHKKGETTSNEYATIEPPKAKTCSQTDKQNKQFSVARIRQC